MFLGNTFVCLTTYCHDPLQNGEVVVSAAEALPWDEPEELALLLVRIRCRSRTVRACDKDACNLLSPPLDSQRICCLALVMEDRFSRKGETEGQGKY